ncbi:MAG: hypothetical protein MHM6MM_007132 [Cercozoa sp. M6MM]
MLCRRATVTQSVVSAVLVDGGSLDASQSVFGVARGAYRGDSAVQISATFRPGVSLQQCALDALIASFVGKLSLIDFFAASASGVVRVFALGLDPTPVPLSINDIDTQIACSAHHERVGLAMAAFVASGAALLNTRSRAPR